MEPKMEEFAPKTADNPLPPFSEWEKSKDITGDTCVFYDIPGHPELVARKMEFMPEDRPEFTESEAREYWEKRIGEFQKIAERYGIPVAKTRYVFDNDPVSGEPSFFAITDRIRGESLDKITSFDKHAEEELDNMYVGILSHMKESYMEGEYAWGDFGNQQIMYGIESDGNESHKKEPHPYIVDVEPRVSPWEDKIDPRSNRSAEEKKEHVFWQNLAGAVAEMTETELKTESGRMAFVKAREALRQIMKELPEPMGQDTKEIRLRVLEEI